MAQPLALHLHYLTWQQMDSIDTDQTILDDVAHNRIPVISWHCLDDLNPEVHAPYTLTNIGNNKAYDDLTDIARHIANLTYKDGSPYPVILRYFWEFNINANAGNDTANGNGGCFGSGSKSNQFINAWIAIQQTLSNAPSGPNITMDWNPNVDNRGPGAVSNAIPFDAFWPGAAYVDWIGLDGYAKISSSSNEPLTFNQLFAYDINDIYFNQDGGPYGKPIMIGETGSAQATNPAYSASPYTQDYYLGDILSTFTYQSGVTHTCSPLGTDCLVHAKQPTPGSVPSGSISAIIYFDGTGQDASYDWILAPGTPGLTAWDNLSANPIFQPGNASTI